MSWSREVKCRYGDLLKTSTPNHHQTEISFPGFPADRALCVVKYLFEYVRRTKDIRGTETRLFLSWRKPHKAVNRDSIRRWTKFGLEKAGIDTSVFCPHSTRAASTSKAAQRLPLSTVLRTAGWRRESTFARFYQKDVVHDDPFGASVLTM